MIKPECVGSARQLLTWWSIIQVIWFGYQLFPATKRSQEPITLADLSRVADRGFEKQFAVLLLTCFPQALIYYEADCVHWIDDENGTRILKEWKGTLIDFRVVFANGLTVYIEVGRSTADRSKKKQDQLRVVHQAGIGRRYLQLGSEEYQKLIMALRNNGSEPPEVTFWQVVKEGTGFDIEELRS